MNIQHLPNDLTLETNLPLQVHDYEVKNACRRNKINLTQNVFSFLTEGTKQLITNNKTTTIGKDQFLVVKAGNCLVSENPTPGNTYRSILFFFTDEMLLNFIEKNKITVVTTPVTDPYHVCQYDDYIRHFVESLKQINQYERNLQRNLLQAKFEEIMIYLMHTTGIGFFQTFLNIQDSQITHLISVVESNALNNLSIQELSFLCNMSVSTFKRQFEKNYQTSPMKWFQHRRLEHSAFLLGTRRHRPVDIYTEIGFESLSSYTQAFKQKFGTTPKQFQMQKLNF